MNGSYQISLKRQIDVYLIPENQREKYFDDLNLEMVKDYSKVHKVKSKYEIQIEISGGEVIFYSILNFSTTLSFSSRIISFYYFSNFS